ncbi:unnamed protein product [Protopolystoma xenopodis]|uniref:Uncharacterized protein n=1 Tax=Protopolystoma xenopodis TaxID=117903 RepID=A0A448WSV0_9PLAT|nr:unnamed protein product [Protopolystoma xenopodis]
MISASMSLAISLSVVRMMAVLLHILYLNQGKRNLLNFLTKSSQWLLLQITPSRASLQLERVSLFLYQKEFSQRLSERSWL